MTPFVLTVSREFGSGGRTVAKAVADRLGVPYYDRNMIELVAEKTGLHPEFVEQRGEHAPSSSHFAYAFISRTPSGVSNDDMLWQAQSHVVEELADKGSCVILGRCADYVLRDRADAVHVFICADTAFKADRIVNLDGETASRPDRRLAEKDKKRRVNYHYYTGRKWGDPKNYDLVLNTARLGIDATVDLIVSYLSAR